MIILVRGVDLRVESTHSSCQESCDPNLTCLVVWIKFRNSNLTRQQFRRGTNNSKNTTQQLIKSEGEQTVARPRTTSVEQTTTPQVGVKQS